MTREPLAMPVYDEWRRGWMAWGGDAGDERENQC